MNELADVLARLASRAAGIGYAPHSTVVGQTGNRKPNFKIAFEFLKHSNLVVQNLESHCGCQLIPRLLPSFKMWDYGVSSDLFEAPNFTIAEEKKKNPFRPNH